MVGLIKPRARKCHICRKSFAPSRPLQKVCSYLCAELHGKAETEKQELKADKANKDASKSRPQCLKLAEKAVNRYVRARDHYEGCCSCDKGSHWDGVWHASHFKSVGSNSRLRFNLWNINKGCSQCNLFKAGNATEYERRLSLKIGADRVEWLKCQNGVTDYSPEYLERLTRVMNKKALRAEKRIRRMVD